MKSLRQLACIHLLILLTATSWADTFPNRPLTLLIGFERGGTLYTQAEVLAVLLSEQLGQPISIQRKPGFGGGIAAAMLATSREQGYVFLFTPSFPITDYPTRLQASFEMDDFRYIAAVSQDQHALVTGRHAPFSDWQGFLAYAREQGTVSYASQNLTDRQLVQLIAKLENFTVRVIPVSGGAGMAPLVLSDDVDIAFSGGTHSRYSDSGDMRLLAAVGAERLAHYPAIPTLLQLGYDVQMQSLRMLVVPSDTPDHQVRVLADATRRAVADPRFVHVTQDIIRQPVRFLEADDLEAFLMEQRDIQLKLIEQAIGE